MSRWHAAVLAGILAVVMTPAPTGGVHGLQIGDQFAPLTDCVESNDSLSVLFIVDASVSLKRTDPDGVRADAVAVGLRALRTRQQELGTDVTVDFVEFGTSTVRSFPNVPSWTSVDDERLDVAVRSFVDRNSGLVTDYAAALEPWAVTPDVQTGALELLEAAPAACRLVMWFSDGDLDIWEPGTDREIATVGGTVTLDSRSDEEAFAIEVESLLCRPGGLIDRLRGPGTTMSDGRNFVVGVGLSDASRPVDFDLFRSMIEGSSGAETCGDTGRSALGVFLAADVSELVRTLTEPVFEDPTDVCEPADVCNATEAFHLGGGLTGFNLLIVTGSDDIGVLLAPPVGDQLRLEASAAGVDLGNGAILDVEQISATTWFIAGELSRADRGWQGDWLVDFAAPNREDHDLSSVRLEVFGDLIAEVQGNGDLRKGYDDGGFTVRLLGADGTPPTSGAWTESSSLIVTIDGEQLETPDVESGNVFRFRVPIDEDDGREDATVLVRLVPRVRVIEGEPPIELDEHLSEWTLPIAPFPRYPVIGEPSTFSPETIDVDHPVARSSTTVSALAEASAGCVFFDGAELTSRPAGLQGDPVITVDGRTADPSRCLRELDVGDEVELEIRVEFTEEQLKTMADTAGGPATVDLRFRSENATDPTRTEEFLFEDRQLLQITPPVETTRDWAKTLALVLPSLLAPIALLYAYNRLIGSRIRALRTGQFADLEVYVSANGVRRIDGVRPLVRDEDLHIAGGVNTTARTVHLRSEAGPVAVFRGRTSINPFGAPSATARLIDEDGPTLSVEGSVRAGRAGRHDLVLDGLWVLAMRPGDHDRFGDEDAEYEARLLLLFGAASTQRDVRLTEIDAEIAGWFPLIADLLERSARRSGRARVASDDLSDAWDAPGRVVDHRIDPSELPSATPQRTTETEIPE